MNSQKLQPADKRVLRDIAARVVSTVTCHSNEASSKEGNGTFCRLFLLTDRRKGFPALVELDNFWAGAAENRGKETEYRMYSLEKAMRLADRARFGQHSSAQSKDPTDDKYAGAILVTAVVPSLGREAVYLIITVSGLAELDDETVGILIARRLSWKIEPADLRLLARLSNNSLALELLTR